MKPSKTQSTILTNSAIKWGPDFLHNRRNQKESQVNPSRWLGLVLLFLTGFSSISLWANTPEETYSKEKTISHNIQKVELIEPPERATKVIHGENNLRFTLDLDTSADDILDSLENVLMDPKSTDDVWDSMKNVLMNPKSTDDVWDSMENELMDPKSTDDVWDSLENVLMNPARMTARAYGIEVLDGGNNPTTFGCLEIHPANNPVCNNVVQSWGDWCKDKVTIAERTDPANCNNGFSPVSFQDCTVVMKNPNAICIEQQDICLPGNFKRGTVSAKCVVPVVPAPDPIPDPTSIPPELNTLEGDYGRDFSSF